MFCVAHSWPLEDLHAWNHSSFIFIFIFQSMEEQTSKSSSNLLWHFEFFSWRHSAAQVTEIHCYSSKGRSLLGHFLPGTISIHPDLTVTFFPTSFPLFSNNSVPEWASWQLPCGLTKTFSGAVKDMFFLLSPCPWSVFYHVRESKICFFLFSFPPIHIKYFYSTGR